MTQQIRRKFTPQEKVAILRQHLLEGKPVSDVCDSHGLKPSLFTRWQKECFENGAAAFEKTDKCIRLKTPLNLDEARRRVSAYVDHYNPHRLHSAIGPITPADKRAGKAPEILENRERKRSKARAQRAENRRLQSERPVGLVS